MRILLIISLLSLIGVIKCRPQQTGDIKAIPVTTQLRTESEQKNGALKETVAMVAKQLTETNITDFTRDTRTPPKIKILHRNTKKPAKAEIEEISHPGVAEPIDVDKFMETTIKSDIPKTTTDSGLSTWILLSGNSPTTKAPKRNSIKPTALPMVTVKFVERTTKIAPKPKITTTRNPTTTTRRPTTTRKSTTTPTTKKPTTVKVETTQVILEAPTKMMTKVKASLLTNAMNNKSKSTTPKPRTTTTVRTITKTTPKITTTEDPTETNDLKPEAKIVDLDLLESRVTTKKPPKKPNNNNANANANKQKKKQKVRRRKPEDQKTKNNSTKVAIKEKPIATQFYNYLSREVMPTVGVGLVGLVVTAGLASYFLFPFTGLRRNYEGALDRKDDHVYDNYYSDGELEQDVIGKMIEGGYQYNTMSNSVYQPYSRYEYNKYDDRIIAERQKESGYTVDDRKYENKFISGNPDSFVPVTPAVVPEHGPRNFPKEKKNDEDSTIIIGKPQSSLLDKVPISNNDDGKFVVGSSLSISENGPRYFPQKIEPLIADKINKKNIQEHSDTTSTNTDKINRKFIQGNQDSFVPITSAAIPQNGPRNFPQKLQQSTFTNDKINKKYVQGNPDSFVPISSAVIPQSGPRHFPEKVQVSETENERKFVVGNIPEGYIPGEPIGIPEHGPRSLRLRRNTPEGVTNLPKDQENEVTSYKEKFNKYKLTKYAEINALNASKRNSTVSNTSSSTTTTEGTPTVKNETTIVYEEPTNIFTFLRNVFEMKVRIGLNFLLNTTNTFSKYLKGVQQRVEHVIKENRDRFKKQQ